MQRAMATPRLRMSDVQKSFGATRALHWEDRPPPGRWTYRVTMSANWLDDSSLGDALMTSTPVTVRVKGEKG